MVYFRTFLFLLLCLGCLLPAGADITLYVSTQGNDAWSGTLAEANVDGTDGPLATITGARDRIRVIRKEEALATDTKVHVAGGVYPITEPIRFYPEDSAPEDHRIEFIGDENNRPIISGGKRITGFVEEDGRWVVTLPEVASGAWDFSNLWVNGERAQPARTPNAKNPWGDYPPDSDFFRTAGPVMAENAETGKKDKSSTAFKFHKEDLGDWDSLEDAIVVTFHSWATSLARIEDIDRKNGILNFTGPARWQYTRWQPNQRYYIEHLYEGLDQPGEWYLNKKAGQLFYIPRAGESIEDAEVIAPVTEQLLVLEGKPEEGKFVEGINFSGIDFQHTEYPIAPEGHSDAQAAFKVSAAIEMVGARNCTIWNAHIGHLANHGVWFRRGSQRNGIYESEITDLGAGGVRIGEGSSPKSKNEATECINILNNYIHEGGRTFRSAVGVWIGRSSENLIKYNEICDFRYTGVSVGWSWGYAESSANHNRIQRNYIHHIGLGQLNDMGGIYCLGISPGTVLRNNVIHDVISHPELYGGWGLYTDEGSTDILLENNLVYNTTTGGFHQHYGKDNIIRNNIFAYSHGPQIIRTRAEEHNSFTFEQNIVYFNTGQALGSNWKGENFKINKNIWWDTSGEAPQFSGQTFSEWQARGNDVDSIVADPGFINAEKGDFHFDFEKGSPVYDLGFKSWEYTKAGLRIKDALYEKAKAKNATRPQFSPPTIAGRLPIVESVRKIWDEGEHNAFTGLVRWKDYWYCTFREAQGHVKGDGAIRIIRSKNGKKWESCGFLTDEGVDLRDPKLCITPDDRLMVNMGGSVYEGKDLVGRRPRVSFSSDGNTWDAPIPVMAEGDWLWRVTWHEGVAYGVSYRHNMAHEPADREWELDLVKSSDGIHYESITLLDIPDRPNETTLRFQPDGECIALVRREAGDKEAWIGTSYPPYTDWNWKASGWQIGGPEFIILPDGSMMAGGRRYPGGAQFGIGPMTRESYEPRRMFESGGDCSYPAMVWHDNRLWVSFYSSHEGKSSIYLAKVRFK